MPRLMGIDLGTTTISIVMLDEESGQLLGSRTVPGNAFIPGRHETSREQDPEKIFQVTLQTMEKLISQFGKPDAIGMTGQMHGMLYTDAQGRAVSPLYTWQDGSGDLACFQDNMKPQNSAEPQIDTKMCAVSAAQLLLANGLAAAAGYGLTTHYYLHLGGLIPAQAAKMTTISDYVGMRLCGNTEPAISQDMAASWGCFDLRAGAFETEKLQALGVDTSLLPAVHAEHDCIGKVSPAWPFAQGVPVCVSFGDNQASFLGAVYSRAGEIAEGGTPQATAHGHDQEHDQENAVLINIGTGSQVSYVTDQFTQISGSIELRPLLQGSYLMAGSGLCGGRAYAMLEGFYREIMQQAGGPQVEDAAVYKMMAEHARTFLENFGKEQAWKVRTTFNGTRSNPRERGSISGIGTGNFTPGALTLGMMQGMLEELYEMYAEMCEHTGKKASRLVGSGNAIRKNPLMRKLAEELFGMKMEIPPFEEEAAAGAAMQAARYMAG